MNSVFITGTPTVGKSHLAHKLCASLGMQLIKTDDLWDFVKDDPELKPWYNYFWDKDEAEYYRNASAETIWQDVVRQSEALYPTVKREIERALTEGTPTIFEGVSLLPHLMQQMPIRGIVLLAQSERQIRDRLKIEPRWSDIAELQKAESHAFFTIENRWYESEAKKYNYPAFDDPAAAEAELLKLIQLD